MRLKPIVLRVFLLYHWRDDRFYVTLQHRILRMKQDVELFLRNMPCRDTAVGLVEFSGDMSEAVARHHLATLDDDAHLRTLLDAIPTQTRDQTCIGCGILRAIEVRADAAGHFNTARYSQYTKTLHTLYMYVIW